MEKRHTLSALLFYGHPLALSILAVALSCLSTHAHAAPHYTPFIGVSLDLSAPCANVHITVDPSLKTGLAVEENTSKLVTIHTAKDGAEQNVHAILPTCKKNAPLSFHLSPSTTLTLHDSPLAKITVSGTLSTLESSLTDTSLQVDHVQSLDLSIHGSSSVHIHQLDRAAAVLTADQAHLSVDKAFLSALSAQMSGASQFIVTEGQIDTLSLDMKDQSSASIMAQLGTVNASTNSDTSLTLGHVTNTLNQSGAGQIHHVTPSDQPATPPQTIPTPPTPTPSTTDGSAQGLGTPQALPPHHAAPSLPPEAPQKPIVPAQPQPSSLP